MRLIKYIVSIITACCGRASLTDIKLVQSLIRIFGKSDQGQHSVKVTGKAVKAYAIGRLSLT